MSNQITENPWEIDTQAADVIAAFHIRIKSIYWHGYTDATHKAALTDKNGNTIIAFDGDTDLTTQEAHDLGWYNGLICSDLDSGKLLVHLD